MAMRPAIFLDKDGTVLADVPYNTRPERMCFAPGAAAGLALLATTGLPLVVISNQPGVALARFSIDELQGVHKRLEEMFAEAGARLAAFYFCPHHPDGVHPDYARVCDCRKPAPGLLHAAAGAMSIDLASSWFIGDILDDVEAGRRAGCRTVLLDNGNETEWRGGPWRWPDRMEKNMEGAGRWIVHCLAGGDRRGSPAHATGAPA
ncbi:MAG TPA: HAD-IIIA family hydrolase [Burkholderiaceae bacterium]|nr:HAD-IIIA family hydrolase [Burkholderiaceae bacterium]